ncbi:MULTISPECIES: L,D-transpeptidase family protein [unclassified Knoellia]|uniref:L,D-transpeptidase family protein n=1 Tax=Knoellia altitudinis TaxID=3404795 RepID=UPI00362319E1
MDIQRHEVSRRAAVAAVVGAGAFGVAGVVATPAHAAVRTLERGHTGADVLALQKRLAQLRYWVGTPDGTFGHLTQQAVWALQKVAGVSRTGKVAAVERSLLSRGVRTRPRSTSGNVLEVDLARQLLFVIGNGALVYVLNTSTGSGERYYSGSSWKTARTPTGSYSIYYRWPNGWQNGSLGSMWRPTYWKGDFAIHGSQSIPPYPASHGCCRVSTAAQDMLWAQGRVAIGRRVWVY